MAEISLGDLYSFNKQAMSQIKPLDPIEFNYTTKHCIEDICRRPRTENYYWMLLNNERKDYTVFNIKTIDGTIREFRETLMNRGQILSIDKQEDENYEIWIRDIKTQENFVYYLFDYNFGVIEA